MIFVIYFFLFFGLLWKKYDVLVLLEEEDCDRLLRILEKEKTIFLKERFQFLLSAFVLATAIAFKNIFISVFFLLFAFKYPYLKLKRQVKILSDKVSYEFPIWLRQVQCLLQSNTVLNAIEVSIERSPKLMKTYLEDLVCNLKEDPSNYVYYQAFMASYDIWGVQNAMQHLYRYNFVSQNEAYQQLMVLNLSTTSWLKKGRAMKYKSYIDSHTYLAFLPMLAVTFLFIILMALVMQGMFEGRWTA